MRVTAFDVLRTRLKSVQRLTYADANAILRGKPHGAGTVVGILGRIAMELLERRRRAGAMSIYDLKKGWALDEEGRFVHLGPTDRHLGYILVQELMILANHCLARWLTDRGIPAPFRVHHVADAVEVEQFMAGVQALLGSADPQLVHDFQSKWGGKLQTARYEPVAGRHFGLALPEYTHGTSPIRRYADLVVQRAIRAALGRGDAPTLDEVLTVCTEMNELETARRAARAETFKLQANAKARHVNNPRFVDNLSDRDFLRVVEIACREHNLTEHLGEAFATRLATGRLQARDFHPLFFQIDRATQPPEQRARHARMLEMVLAHLDADPAQAIALLQMAVQSGQVEPLEAETDEHPSPAGPTFRCRMTSGPRTGPWRAATTKKRARARAHHALLQTLAGIAASPDEGSAPAVSPAAAAGPVVFPADTLNGPAWLNEYVQRNKLPPPAYDVRRDAAGFRCLCRCGPVEGSGVGANKKEAKARAADEVVAQLKPM